MATAAGTTPEFVAAIDFGTYCSAAYLHPDLEPSKVDPTILMLNSHRDRRVASCILFVPSGKKIAFVMKLIERNTQRGKTTTPLL